MRIIAFPARGPFAVHVGREDEGWLVVCRQHGWLHGSRHEALADAAEIASGFGVACKSHRRSADGALSQNHSPQQATQLATNPEAARISARMATALAAVVVRPRGHADAQSPFRTIGDKTMTTQQRDNSGILFRNDRKETGKHPDYNGSATIAGVEYWISAWLNEGQKGKFFSFAFTPKQEPKSTRPRRQDLNDEIPF
jgi:hypothetical protein